jgi:hypothetical protein
MAEGRVMNERFRELAEQVDIIKRRNVSGRGWDYTMLHNQFEDFAKLIVKECVRHFNEDYQRDFDTLWREDLSKSIKQHFGIEE